MSRKILKLSMILCLFITFACRDDDNGMPVSDDEMEVVEMEEEEEEMDPEMENEALYNQLKSDFIYDDDELHSFELILSEENLNIINSDPAAEEYVEGKIKFNGETFGPVGIRYKGSIGAFVNCLSNPNWANPSGFKICPKLSMKIKCNWEDSSRKFYGLKKLQFHAMNLDGSQMHDRLGYHLFREMGVKAPRCVHAKLYINGTFNGVFALVEQIDGRFTDYHYEDGDGNLYKEVWPMNMDGTARSESEFLAGLKTNEDDDPQASIIHAFASAVEQAEEDELKSVIEQWMDVQEILSYCVVDRTIKHDDGPFHWYCNFGNCEPHNFYWYETPGDQKVHLIPWDLDNAFENILSPNAVTNIRDNFGEVTNNCRPFNHGLWGLSQWSAACDKLTGAWVLYENDYEALINEFKNGPLSQGNTDALLDKWAAQINDATEEARATHSNEALHPNDWQNAINQLKNSLQKARE